MNDYEDAEAGAPRDLTWWLRKIRAWGAVAAAVGTIVAQILAQNVFNTEADYGRIDIPGTKVLHFPAQTIDVSLSVYYPSAGNEDTDVPIPQMSLVLHPLDGGQQPTVTENPGLASGSSHPFRRVWTMDVPSEGDYRVRVTGRVEKFFNPQLLFGATPRPWDIYLIGGIVLAEFLLLPTLALAIIRRR